MKRKKCSVPICGSWSTRAVLGNRYCEPCAASVEQACYMQSLPAAAAEVVLYRHTFSTAPPQGVELPEPLAAIAPREGWRSRK